MEGVGNPWSLRAGIVENSQGSGPHGPGPPTIALGH